MNKKIYVSVDFDGTIVTHEYPEIGTPIPGALECLKRLNEENINIILQTMRSDHRMLNDGPDYLLTDAVRFLKAYDIKLFAVNCNPDQYLWTTSNKIYAHFYIDDTAIGCPLIYPENGKTPYVDWEKASEYLFNYLDIVKNKTH